jgi:hypothetical protein
MRNLEVRKDKMGFDGEAGKEADIETLEKLKEIEKKIKGYEKEIEKLNLKLKTPGKKKPKSKCPGGSKRKMRNHGGR